ERDCSLQRRHQKVIEEAPAPGMDAATREAICAAAVRAAKAVDYEGAGTIEFIADGSGVLSADRIWFMEMNTRLQVEHPVTEAITGVDLVEWQLRVASGEPLPKRQDELSITGWAMEARLYAEDPARGFLPSVGRLEAFELGNGPGARIDTGVEEGAEVSPFYDPMIAKVIAAGADRDEARVRLRDLLNQSVIWPVRTNASFLIAALEHRDFVRGSVDTGLIGRDGEAMAVAPSPSRTAMHYAASDLMGEYVQPRFRLNASPKQTAQFCVDGLSTDVPLALDDAEARQTEWVHFRINGHQSVLFSEKGQTWEMTPWRVDGSGHQASDGAILSPMPGKVIAVEVAAGQAVSKGQKLLTLEAMKMEHSLTAPFDGVVAELNVSAGAQVQVDALLVRVEKAE
ncbi:MAG: biotin/lipoyl-containing protein, partial [Pseudomonadota bacterium]